MHLKTLKSRSSSPTTQVSVLTVATPAAPKAPLAGFKRFSRRISAFLFSLKQNNLCEPKEGTCGAMVDINDLASKRFSFCHSLRSYHNYQSARPMKVKVVKWCRKKMKWALSAVYLTQTIMWKQTKKSLKQLKRLISVISHLFPVEIVQNSKSTKTMQTQTLFFSDWRYPVYVIGKLTSRAFWKCGVFCFYNFLNRTYGCSKLGPNWRKKFFERRHKK